MARELTQYLDDHVAQDGEPTELMQAFHLARAAEADLMLDRQRAYGSGNIAKFGAHGVVIRSSDKLERLANLLFRRTPSGIANGTNESIEDSFGDLANYGTIGILLERGWWGLPFLDEVQA